VSVVSSFKYRLTEGGGETTPSRMESGQTRDRLDFRLFLLDELEKRRRRNPSFSLRALAKKVGVSAPYLSQVLAGKRVLSDATGTRFANRLAWATPRRRAFIDLIRYRRAPNDETRELVLRRMRDLDEVKFLELGQDQFRLIADSCHFAIAELTLVGGFSSDPDWIARRLGITRREAESALDRLKRVGVLEARGDEVRKTQGHFRIKDVPSEAIRAFHQGNLAKAAVALEKQSYDSRDFSGATLAVNQADLPEIKRMIRSFRQRLNRYAESRPGADSVYQLSVQLFRLDQEIS
jgi:uncharacterized protein (TIGR02147 family)